MELITKIDLQDPSSLNFWDLEPLKHTLEHNSHDILHENEPWDGSSIQDWSIMVAFSYKSSKIDIFTPNWPLTPPII